MSEHILNSHWEDDNGVEWPVKVYFDYHPVERRTHDHPGCDSEVTINDIKRTLFNDKWFSFVEEVNEKDKDKLEMECFEMMESGDE